MSYSQFGRTHWSPSLGVRLCGPLNLKLCSIRTPTDMWNWCHPQWQAKVCSNLWPYGDLSERTHKGPTKNYTINRKCLKIKGMQWAIQDSNLWPHGCDPCVLVNRTAKYWSCVWCCSWCKHDWILWAFSRISRVNVAYQKTTTKLQPVDAIAVNRCDIYHSLSAENSIVCVKREFLWSFKRPLLYQLS